MVESGSAPILRPISFLLAVYLLTFPAHAEYSGGTGEPNDPYEIATPADLIALGETPDDYDKQFILTADIDLDPNLPGREIFDTAVIVPSWETPFTGLSVHTHPGQHSLEMPVCHKTSDTGVAAGSVMDGGVSAGYACDPLVHNTATVRQDQLFS